MSAVGSLVPARFLTIIAHLVIVITIFWSRENNVKACLPLDFTPEQYNNEDRKLVVGLAVTLGLFLIELAGFFSGVSMFSSSQGLLYCCMFASSSTIATGAHASASVALLFFLFEQWECDIYWWILAICSASVSLSFFVFEKWECWTYWVIFAICSVLPAFVEILLFIAVFGLKKKPL